MHQVVRLTIEFRPDTGGVAVQGPPDKILCYGMLEAAKDLIRDHKPNEGKGGILIASRLPAMPSMNGG